MFKGDFMHRNRISVFACCLFHLLTAQGLRCWKGYVEYDSASGKYHAIGELSEVSSSSGSCLTVCYESASTMGVSFFLHAASSRAQCINPDETCDGNNSNLTCIGVDCCSLDRCNNASTASCNPISTTPPVTTKLTTSFTTPGLVNASSEPVTPTTINTWPTKTENGKLTEAETTSTTVCVSSCTVLLSFSILFWMCQNW